MGNITTLLALISSLTLAQAQTVTYCPLYLALQNRCPTASTTVGPPTTSTLRMTTAPGASNASGNGTTDSSDSDVTDACGLPTITFCPAIEVFLNGGRRCDSGQTVQMSLTTLGQLLINPSGQNAAAAVGAGNVEALGNALSSVSKSIKSTPTQATVGVTFIPVGQLIGSG